ncbi:unnamed protein product [Brachionus calyciflorus]|uniref:Zinc transporter 2-like n=1 Tax=Brachionus calyciflorus TaxID=104777 RepID=A0A813MGE1_9BILA|nr:unnamed protein product [Brachionus calyciflorus]
MLNFKEKLAPNSTSNALSNNFELNENKFDIGFVSDLEKARSINHLYSHRRELSDDDVPMLNPNFDQETPSSPSEVQSVLFESDHCHIRKEKKPNRNKTVWRKLIIVVILCIIFMIGEIIGGIIAKSISIQTDAAHMASDIVGFFFSIVAIYVSEKEPTRRMSFGFYRSEILGALFSTLVIWILTGVLVYLAIVRVIYQEFDIEPKAMVITASCGVVFNIIMYFVLHTNIVINGINLNHHGHSHSGDGHGHSHNHSHSHSHGHGHSHSHSNKKNQKTLNVPINDNFISLECSDQTSIIQNDDENESQHNDGENINLRAAAIHVIGDFIQSIGVLVAAIIIYFKPEYKLADPICTFIFSILVFATTAPIIKDIFFVLMEAVPANLNYDSIVNDLCSLDNVKKAHNLHVWCLTMDKLALSVHIVTEKEVDTQEILRQVNQVLRSKYKIERTTIQVEYFVDGMIGCEQCKLPN